jgi:ketosteroid isomerase-like protein
MPDNTPSPREMVELVRRMVEGTHGIQFADLFAEDGILEYPFAAPGFPTVYKGQQAIRDMHEAAGQFRALFDIEGMTTTVYESTDPEVVVAEITHSGHSHTTGRPYDFLALAIIRVRHGKIVHYRDFMNPLAVAELLGRLPDLASAISAA